MVARAAVSVALSVLFLAACSSTVAPTAPAPTQSRANTPSEQPTEPPNPNPSATPAPSGPVDTGVPQTPSVVEIAVGPGEFELLDPAIGLESLASYSAHTQATFNGTVAGTPTEWSVAWQKTKANPAMAEFTREVIGPGVPLTPGHAWQADGTIYRAGDKGSCTAARADPEQSDVDVFEPAAQLLALIGAESAGNEIIDGIAASHYSFDQRALGLTGVTTSSGELWVATDGGYLLRYQLASRADEPYFGQGTAGTITWDYELSGVNQPATVTLPTGCPPGLVYAPRLADAAEVLNVPGALEYDTASSVDDVLAFYVDQASQNGWATVTAPTTTDDGGLFQYSADGQMVSVLVRSDESATRVIITMLGGTP
jgi:hypothetical protein